MKALHQHEHEAINAREYPGTRQLCATCDEPTGRCEEDSIFTEDGDGPLCPDSSNARIQEPNSDAQTTQKGGLE